MQSYIQAAILQPKIELVSEQNSILTWDPPKDNALNIKGENDNLPPGNWKVPVFTIKNKSPINAQDVNIKWSAAKYDVSTLTANALIFQGHQVAIAINSITLSGGGIPHQNPIGFSAAYNKPFITRSAETFIPLDVWNSGALFFAATLPAQPGSRSEPYYFDLEISWSIPENAKPARYKIKAVATNTKLSGVTSPALMATIEFSVEPDS